jgi:Arc/MetJ family transcription regulator
MCMRTNIVLNEELLREAMQYSKATTKRALVEEALQVLVHLRSAEKRRQTYRERLSVLDRKLAGLTLREPPLSVLRHDRESR